MRNPFFYRFPYTNLNDINLDWIIKKVKILQTRVDNLDPEDFAERLEAVEAQAEQASTDAAQASADAAQASTDAAAAVSTANSASSSASQAMTAANNAQQTADGKTDISLGITGASSGNLLQILSVDNAGKPTSYTELAPRSITAIDDILTYDSTIATIEGASWQGWGHLARLTVAFRPVSAHTYNESPVFVPFTLKQGLRPPGNNALLAWQPTNRFISLLLKWDGTVQCRADLNANELVQIASTYYLS